MTTDVTINKLKALLGIDNHYLRSNKMFDTRKGNLLYQKAMIKKRVYFLL